MSDLREKIVGCLRAWTEDVVHDIEAYGEERYSQSEEDLADHILALLPKVPELRWEGKYMMLGEFPLGSVRFHNYSERWYAYQLTTGSFSGFDKFDDARDAVEAAVRKALGWEA